MTAKMQTIKCPLYGDFRVPAGRQLPDRYNGSGSCMVPEDCLLRYERAACLTEAECLGRIRAFQGGE